MPNRQISIVWTALPAGVVESGKLLRIAVHVSPRLKTDEGPRPTLQGFADYFEDWAGWVRKLQFQVHFEPGPTVQAKAASTPSSDLWKAMFPLDTYVRPYEFRRLDDRLIFSYPVANVHTHVQGIYQKYARTAPDQFPSRLTLWRDEALQAVSFIHDRVEGRGIFDLIGGKPITVPSPDELRKTLVQRMGGTTGLNVLALPGAGRAVPPGPPDPTLDFFQVRNFFQPRNAKKPDRDVVDEHGVQGKVGNQYQRLPAVIPLPDVDFHQIVSTLGQYPKLLRDLGLVVELEVPIEKGFVGQTGAPDGPTVQIEPVWPGDAPSPSPKPIRPKTVYVQKGDRFAARPSSKKAELTDGGLLRLTDGGYELVQVDIDGAALKTMNFSNGLYRSLLHRSSDSPVQSSLPSLRSAGLSLARTGNALRLAGRFKVMAQREANLDSNPMPLLYAEDLVRGYRVDVWDDRSKGWRSLHQRSGAYVFDDGQKHTYPDEGFTQLAVSSAADGSSTDLFLHEIFATWNGWSLSVPRPGSWLTDDSNSERNRPRANTDVHVETTFTALPGSLPRLRFGTGYRLRVRGVDLAGNSPTFDGLDSGVAATPMNPVPADDFSAATASRTYLRFEPVPPPVVVLRDEITSSPGESLERLVIRSRNTDEAKDSVPTDESAERHLAPPKGAWTLAEAHGRLDMLYASPQQARDPQRLKAIYDLVAKKDAELDSNGQPIETGGPTAKGAFRRTKPLPAPESPQMPGAANPIYDADQIAELPYLPDPIARGVSFIDLPGVPAGSSYRMSPDGLTGLGSLKPAGTIHSLAQVDYRPPPKPAAWYDLGAFRVALVDATGRSDLRPRWDADRRLLTVYLPKGEKVEVPYSSFLNEDDLPLMAIWDLIAQAKPGNLDLLRQLALDGRHWMLTPPRTLVLVHAVQQPLQPPSFSKLEPKRLLGRTYATLTDTLGIDGKSTSKVDIRGEWSEWIDVPAESEPRRRSGAAHVCEIHVDDPTSDSLALDHRHDFGDTKYRHVLYRATATTRFREYFPQDVLADEGNITRSTIDEPDAQHAQYKSAVVDIPSSARPDAPRVLYVVPAFRWVEEPGPASPSGSSATSRREGGWLRVYMDRPWYSSGDGEQLGVLIWTDTFNRIPAEYRPYVTQWGNDPIWRSGATAGGAKLTSFKAATATRSGGLTLDELTAPATAKGVKIIRPIVTTITAKGFDVQGPVPKSQTQVPLDQYPGYRIHEATDLVAIPVLAKGEKKAVNARPALVNATSLPTLAVAGHDVQYDADRRLWYSDIHIDAGPSYFPFVRLALVRYQPISVPDAHISRVVIADFVQLAPDRSVTIAFDPKKPKEVRLSVHGLTYDRSVAMERPAPLQIRVETLRTDVPEELGWVPAEDVKVDRGKARGRQPPLWTGKIQLPVPRGSRRYRVVVQEYEGYVYQPGPSEANIAGVSRAARLVYAHAVEM